MKFVNTWMRAVILEVYRTIEDIPLISHSRDVVYLITCKKCALHYVGSTIN